MTRQFDEVVTAGVPSKCGGVRVTLERRVPEHAKNNTRPVFARCMYGRTMDEVVPGWFFEGTSGAPSRTDTQCGSSS